MCTKLWRQVCLFLEGRLILKGGQTPSTLSVTCPCLQAGNTSPSKTAIFSSIWVHRDDKPSYTEHVHPPGTWYLWAVTILASQFGPWSDCTKTTGQYSCIAQSQWKCSPVALILQSYYMHFTIANNYLPRAFHKSMIQCVQLRTLGANGSMCVPLFLVEWNMTQMFSSCDSWKPGI